VGRCSLQVFAFANDSEYHDYKRKHVDVGQSVDGGCEQIFSASSHRNARIYHPLRSTQQRPFVYPRLQAIWVGLTCTPSMPSTTNLGSNMHHLLRYSLPYWWRRKSPSPRLHWKPGLKCAKQVLDTSGALQIGSSSQDLVGTR
jgi:hypothetical protein